MADVDNEQVVEDADADTQDVTEEEKTDEEQVVEDTDADTGDVERTLDDVISRIDDLEKVVNDKFDGIAKLFISSGAVVTDEDEAPVAEEDETSDSETLDELDYNL